MATSTRESGPIFIVGCERSGTTLMRLMLNRHPRIAIPGETWYFHQLDAARTELLANADWRGAVGDFLESQSTFDELGVTRNALNDCLDGLTREDWSSVLAVANLAFCRVEGKRRWGDKTPGYVLQLDLIRRAFPDAFVIHMIRDCRDVVVSLLEQPFGPKSVLDGAQYWQLRVQRGRTEGTRYFGQRYLEVRYEDLVTDPSRELRRVCNAISEDFDERLLEQNKDSSKYLKPDHYWHEQTTKPVTTGRIGRWRAALTSRDVQLIELEAGGLLRDLGYELERPGDPRVFLEWLFAKAKRAWRNSLLAGKVSAYRLLSHLRGVRQPQRSEGQAFD